VYAHERFLMARTELERTVQPSIIDRLLDTEPRLAGDPQLTREESERRFRAAVRRDVEWLLNTRRTMMPAPDWCPETRESVYEYGLVDTTGIPVGTSAGRKLLLSSIKTTIERFEPRLANANIQLVEGEDGSGPQIRFVVSATLLMDPSPEQVVFDTVLEVGRGEYEVFDAGQSASNA
jgi:type VI secretion system protein ImpF